MRLNELVHDIDEGWKSKLAAAGLGATLAAGGSYIERLPHTHKVDPKVQYLTKAIINGYKIGIEDALHIVQIAKKYEKDTFPKAEDILSIIGIESSFNPNAVSKLKKDPAKGLMQVRPKTWKIDPEELNDIENQIKHGSEILHKYYTKLGDKEKAIKAYNVGLKGSSQSKFKSAMDRYAEKYKKERNRYIEK